MSHHPAAANARGGANTAALTGVRASDFWWLAWAVPLGRIARASLYARI